MEGSGSELRQDALTYVDHARRGVDQPTIGAPLLTPEQSVAFQQTESAAQSLFAEMMRDEFRQHPERSSAKIRKEVIYQLLRDLKLATDEQQALEYGDLSLSKKAVGARVQDVSTQLREVKEEVLQLRRALDLARARSLSTEALDEIPLDISVPPQTKWDAVEQEVTVKMIHERLSRASETADQQFLVLREHHQSLANPSWRTEVKVQERRLEDFRAQLREVESRRDIPALLVTRLHDQIRVQGNLVYLIVDQLRQETDRVREVEDALRLVGSDAKNFEERVWLQQAFQNESITLKTYVEWLFVREQTLARSWLAWLPARREQLDGVRQRRVHWEHYLRAAEHPPMSMESLRPFGQVDQADLEEVVEEELPHVTIILEDDRTTIVPDFEREEPVRVQPTTLSPSESFSSHVGSWVRSWARPLARVLPFLFMSGHDGERYQDQPVASESTVDVAPIEAPAPQETVPVEQQRLMEIPHGSTIWGELRQELVKHEIRPTNGRLAELTHAVLEANGLTAAEAAKLPDNKKIDFRVADELIARM